jgi:cytidine deaminase
LRASRSARPRSDRPAAARVTVRQTRALVASARAARTFAVAPYSQFKVGAALLSADGTTFTGCNVENASYGLTVCAERVALLKALSEGQRNFVMIAVVADTGAPTPPCGACRQLLWEYCGDIAVVLANLTGIAGRHQMKDLLPLPFDGRLLGGSGSPQAPRPKPV